MLEVLLDTFDTNKNLYHFEGMGGTGFLSYVEILVLLGTVDGGRWTGQHHGLSRLGGG